MVKQYWEDTSRAQLAEAIARAESGTSGEVLVVSSELSDSYHDVGLHYAIGVMFLKLGAIWAMGPDRLHALMVRFWGWDGPSGHTQVLGLLFVWLAAVFLVVRYAMAWMPVRLRLTPRATKQRRVRRRAVLLFNAMARGKTSGKTAVLLYISQGEHMAELVVDEAIHASVPPEMWGEAMVALIDELRAGRMVDGLVAAIDRIGVVLHRQLPVAPGDINELPDRIIEL
jgi:putative membrane protein